MARTSLIAVTPPQQQRGAVLIVALIMLLLLTMIGVAGMRDTQLQEKMSGSNEDRAAAFQAAESALRAGESEITVVGGSPYYAGGCSTGCYMDYSSTPSSLSRVCSNGNCTESQYWQEYAWTTGTNSKEYAGSGLTQVTAKPRYVIERLPSGTYSAVTGTTNDGSSSGTGVQTVADFLVTARGVGKTTDAVVILQSVYRVTY